MASVPEARMFARETENRAIAIAFLASLALHLLLLAAWPMLRDPMQRTEFSPGPIIARLLAPKLEAPAAVAPPQAAGSGETGVESTPAPEPEDAAKAVAEAFPTSKPLRTARAQPEPSPTEKRGQTLAPKRVRPEQSESQATSETPVVLLPGAAPPESEAAVPPVAQAAAPAVAAIKPHGNALRGAPEPAAPSATPKPRAMASAPEAPAAGTLAQYRLAVIETAKRYKRYPRVALDNNWEGRVEVRMVVGADGAIVSLGVRASTGHEVLDLEALEMIRQAKLQTPIPAALRGRELAIEIPVIFNLRDPGA